MKEKYFQHFLECLMKAIKRIDTHYTHLFVAENDKEIYRERVYCYELYHQLRFILGDSFPYKLDGELDKSGHTCYPNGEKPDFVIHVPGKMEQNLLVIEVKPVTVVEKVITKLRDDFEKLGKFISTAKYYRAIMLIYSSGNDNLPQNIEKEIKLFQDRKIITLWHYKPNEEPKIIGGERYTLSGGRFC